MSVKSLDVRSSDDQRLSASEPTYSSARSFSAQSYVRRALNVFSNLEIVVPGKDHLELLVRLALDAQQLFFAVALFHPGETQLDHFFDEFIRLCAIP
jgi:hypothetical protein